MSGDSGGEPFRWREEGERERERERCIHRLLKDATGGAYLLMKFSAVFMPTGDHTIIAKVGFLQLRSGANMFTCIQDSGLLEYFMGEGPGNEVI